MKKVSIVGFGRFGKTLYRLIKDDFIVSVYEKGDPVEKIYNSEVIFYCVPISSFENVIASHKKYFQKKHILIDVLSVKMYPAKVFKKYLTDTNTQALLTHPMFGPDSSKEGFAGLPLIMDKFMTDEKTYQFFKAYFKDKGLNIIEMSAQAHDKMAASSQGLTHFIGRLLDEYGFKKTFIDSLGAKKLLEVMDQTCNDTWQLFLDLQNYNPYTPKMRLKLSKAYDRLYAKLLPERVNPEFLIFGIQGGKGSFNEEALQAYVKKNGIRKYKVKYLYTAENVLNALQKGTIDRGQFAIQNSVGGIVEETLQAIAKYKFKIVEEFAVKISHALMIRKDAELSNITTIMTHPQVLAQCKQTLLRKYPNLKQVSGEKELIDQSMVARLLSQKKLPKHVATMGSKIIAEIYNLQIIEDNLQDARENYTSFLQITRLT
ncbi:prephenate dehydrogenase/arogenate dehydrogenase family protein [Candidatus Daviesbacteria bacterium]|nr:prephenate dehydrogenase/arogenate dehydrogenase family protein [Candidatus Daviesbacteria bacterium]